MSSWHEDDGGTVDRTHWDARDRDWEPGKVQYDWHLEDGVWYVNTCRYRILEIYYDALDLDLPAYEESVTETNLLSILLSDVVRRYI
jgi:hypothetical protein